MKVYLNGKFIDEKRATVSIHDHGFLYGDGVYETMRVYGGRVFLLGEHLRRLKASLEAISLDPKRSLSALGHAVEKTVRLNKLKEAAVRLTVTRGPGPHGFDPRPCKTPTVLITARPFDGPPKKGAVAAVVATRRNSPEALPPAVKSTSCLNNILAKIEANRLGADEAVMLADDGTVAEGTVSNVFIVKNKHLFTPVLDGRQLAGVTRETVCRLAREAGLRVSETKITVAELRNADEAFLTSSIMEIWPVRTWIVEGKQQVMPVSPEKTTTFLQKCYRTFTRS